LLKSILAKVAGSVLRMTVFGIIFRVVFYMKLSDKKRHLGQAPKRYQSSVFGRSLLNFPAYLNSLYFLNAEALIFEF
jgi:hypothetical protein